MDARATDAATSGADMSARTPAADSVASAAVVSSMAEGECMVEAASTVEDSRTAAASRVEVPTVEVRAAADADNRPL
jgi:hypothetical protein